MKFWKGSLAMLRMATLVLMVGTLALSSCADTTSQHDHADHPHAGETSAAGQPAPNNAADVTFATDMIPHHEQAVAMAGLVPARSTDPAVIALAREISAAQGPEIEAMKGFLVQWNAGPDDHGDSMAGMPMQGMVDDATMNRLTSMTGAEFDTLWLRSMIGHHEGAIAMARTELADGLDPDAKTLAQQIVTAQQAEIAQMTEMGGPMTTDETKTNAIAVQGYSSNKEDYAKRLRRIEGQVRGVAKMIDEEKYCIDVLTQISAVNSALQSVALGLLDEHLGHCVSHAVAEGGDEATKKIAEASAAIARLVKS